MKKYELGNCLRGAFGGEFESHEEAWSVLSHRFLLSYPSEDGRTVIMKVQEEVYGILQWVICRHEKTDITPRDRDDTMARTYRVSIPN